MSVMIISFKFGCRLPRATGETPAARDEEEGCDGGERAECTKRNKYKDGAAVKTVTRAGRVGQDRRLRN